MSNKGNTQSDSCDFPDPIVENKETVICLPSDIDNDDFGIELTGGCHSYLGVICIHKIYENSAAHSDGRLRRGDIIIDVNGKSMKKASLEEAKLALIESPHPLQLTLIRDPDPLCLFTSIEEPKIFITVELWKNHTNEPLGISLLERKGIGVFVTWISPNSPAELSQRIRQGDKIIDINGTPVKGLDQSQVAASLREAEHSVVLVLGRIPALHAKIQDWIHDRHFQRKPLNVVRTSSWSHSDIHLLRAKKSAALASRRADENSLGRRQSRRFSAFNLRLRSNSTHMERLAVHSAPPPNNQPR
ncbi:putative Multiple PDZ domain protein [Hypsibius exemplaris]|uniref:Multiple PDZ domain protein n=1 Tax=Hypsibius exemplaris TaxID=2072580 RepID=A0A1W0WQI5_HYPEX|nr:putative Multiple PDZ domain protein [Hypsibius exemplaris]